MRECANWAALCIQWHADVCYGHNKKNRYEEVFIIDCIAFHE